MVLKLLLNVWTITYALALGATLGIVDPRFSWPKGVKTQNGWQSIRSEFSDRKETETAPCFRADANGWAPVLKSFDCNPGWKHVATNMRYELW